MLLGAMTVSQFTPQLLIWHHGGEKTRPGKAPGKFKVYFQDARIDDGACMGKR